MRQKPIVISFGELMLRMDAPGGLRFTQSTRFDVKVAGAEANVAALLAQLGISSKYITRVPKNDLAMMAVNELRKWGIDASLIMSGGERMALYFVERGNHIRSTQVIYDRSFSSFSTLTEGDIDWENSLKDASMFHWSGISPALSESAAAVCAEGIRAARKRGVVISSDFNYRRALWNYGKLPGQVMPALLKDSEIAVADIDAAKAYFDIDADSRLSYKEQFEQCYRALVQRMPSLKTLAMSFRKVNGLSHEYMGALAQEGSFYFSPIHHIPYITEQIGSGDAFTGGLLASIIKGYAPQKIIESAVACGVLKQSVYGDWALVTEEEIERFIQNGSSSRINR